MANICVVCGKGPRVANNVSNANNKTTKWLYPNVHVIRFRIPGSKTVRRGAVCSRCIRSGKVEKVLSRKITYSKAAAE